MIRFCPTCNKKFKTCISTNKKYCSLKCYGENLKVHPISYWQGKKRSKEDRLKFKLSHIGIKYPNRKKPVFLKPDGGWFKKGHKAWNKGKRDCWSPEQLRKILVFRRPNKQEIYLTELFQTLYPNEWKYVGNGELVIEGKNPDFVNINGQKKIIELFGTFWHEKKEEKERADIFARYGYRTLIIWSSELYNKNKLLTKIHQFHEL